MTRKKEIVIADEEKQIDDTNKLKKKSFVRVPGQNKLKSANSNVKTNINSKTKDVDLLDAEVLHDDDDSQESSKEENDIIDIGNYKDSDAEVILDDSEVLPSLGDEEDEDADDSDFDDSICSLSF